MGSVVRGAPRRRARRLPAPRDPMRSLGSAGCVPRRDEEVIRWEDVMTLRRVRWRRPDRRPESLKQSRCIRSGHDVPAPPTPGARSRSRDERLVPDLASAPGVFCATRRRRRAASRRRAKSIRPPSRTPCLPLLRLHAPRIGDGAGSAPGRHWTPLRRSRHAPNGRPGPRLLRRLPRRARPRRALHARRAHAVLHGRRGGLRAAGQRWDEPAPRHPPSGDPADPRRDLTPEPGGAPVRHDPRLQRSRARDARRRRDLRGARYHEAAVDLRAHPSRSPRSAARRRSRCSA